MKALSNEIIVLLNKKQEAAFEVVFSLYYPRLVYFAKEYVPYADAKNLVQDAFVTFWEKNPVFINESQLQSYLYTNVKNNCLMYLKHEKVKKKYADNLELKKQNRIHYIALDQLNTSVITFQEIETIIEKTIADLPPRCREIFLLSRSEGKKNQQIADHLDINIKSVEAQITKAIKIFKIALKDYLPILSFFITS